MGLLGGDSFFNKWSTPLIPFARLCRVDVATYKGIFAKLEDAEQADAVSTEDYRTAEETALLDEQRIPFPQEHDSLLAQEMIRVCDQQSQYHPIAWDRVRSSVELFKLEIDLFNLSLN